MTRSWIVLVRRFVFAIWDFFRLFPTPKRTAFHVLPEPARFEFRGGGCTPNETTVPQRRRHQFLLVPSDPRGKGRRGSSTSMST